MTDSKQGSVAIAPVDGLELVVISAIALIIATVVGAGLSQFLSDALMYGGDMCKDTKSMVVVCGLYPVGLSISLLVGFGLALPINAKLKQVLIADD